MNLTLHWLRRDLRRHALLILLWALLVALFTWARLWFRQQGLEHLPDRYSVLIGAALALGMAELFLMLRILLDDPAGGTGTFWKTRPPSGGAVFAAKAALLVLVSLVIPFTAEWVFLSIAGPSTDAMSRAICLLLPPVFALMAGAAAAGWKQVVAWLPASFAVMLGAMMASRWLHQQQIVIRHPNWLLSIAAVLAVAGGLAWFFYHRRKAQRLALVLAMTLPAGAFTAASSVGFAEGPWANPPAGLDATKIQLLPRPFGPGETFTPTIAVRGIPPDYVFHTRAVSIGTVMRLGSGQESSGHLEGMGMPFNAVDAVGDIIVPLPDPGQEFKRLIHSSSFTATGRVFIYCYRKETLRVPLDGRPHEFSNGGARRRIRVPALEQPELMLRAGARQEDVAGVWSVLELIGEPVGPWFPGPPENETRLRHTGTGEVIPLVELSIDPHAPLWEGAGFSRQRLVPGDIKPEQAAPAYARLEQIAAGAGSASPWVLEVDVLVPAGRLELPYSLSWPGLNE